MENKKRGATTKKTPTDDNNSIVENTNPINRKGDIGTQGLLRFGASRFGGFEVLAEEKGDTGIAPLTRAPEYQANKKLHRQARGYLKSVASSVGKDTSGQKTLFEIPHFDEEINPYKEVLSKMTAITGNLLLALWQANKDENDIYTIRNLSEVARQLKVSPQELKLYLIYLGGYQRPIAKIKYLENGKYTEVRGNKKIQKPKYKKVLQISHDKIFYISFNILFKDNETENSFTNDDKVGTHYLSFIKDRDIDSVEIKPTESLQEEIAGKGLGNVLVNDSFIAFSLGLSDLAYKIFCLSGSNKPTFSISFNKLINTRYLNLETQVRGTFNKSGKLIKKGQGQARIKQRIKDALTELQSGGHLRSWKHNEDTDIFYWTYSDTFIKHKVLIEEKAKTLEIKALPLNKGGV